MRSSSDRSFAAIAAVIGPGTSAAGVYGGGTRAGAPEPVADPDPAGWVRGLGSSRREHELATIRNASRTDFMAGRTYLAALPFLLLLRVRLRECLEHALILEGRGVAAGLRARRDLAQQPPHDLARPRLRHRLGEPDLLGSRECPDLRHDVLAQFLGERVVGDHARARRHERDDRLPLELVGAADDALAKE